jgi:hypothetical protein
MTDCTGTLTAPLRLRYRSSPAPALLCAVGDAEFATVDFGISIPAADYRPCILLYGMSATVSATVVDPGAASKHRPPNVVTRSASLAKMWDDRVFTDAEVICEGQVFPVHRTVLATASPVFLAAFSGNMQEAKTARIEIGDASVDAVEALLRHVYTSELKSDCALVVLPLAHRYQLADLVLQCCEEVIQTLSAEHVAEVVRTMRLYRYETRVCMVAFYNSCYNVYYILSSSAISSCCYCCCCYCCCCCCCCWLCIGFV